MACGVAQNEDERTPFCGSNDLSGVPGSLVQ
jgi:hypothetical protein